MPEMSTQKVVAISAAIALVVVVIYLVLRPKREGYRPGGGVPACRATLAKVVANSRGKVVANSRGKVTLSFGSFTRDWTVTATNPLFYAPLGSTWRVAVDSTNRPCTSSLPQLIRP